MTNYVVSSGVTSADLVLNAGDTLSVEAGGTAVATTLNLSAFEGVDGLDIATIVNSGAVQIVYAGGLIIRRFHGIAEFTVVEPGGEQVLSGGTASGATIAGSQFISSGGVAENTTISNGGSATVFVGGTASSTDIASGGVLTVSSGGVASGTVVNYGGIMTVSSGGVASGTVVSSAGFMSVSSGGVASGTVVSNGGFMTVSSGGVASGTLVQSGQLGINLGGAAIGTIV